MNIIALAALFAWIPLTVALFALLPPRRAVLVALIGGCLFLPMAQVKVPVWPAFSKANVTALGALFGALIFDLRRVLKLRPRWFDLPMLLWCLCPIASSLSNGLGVYDGISSAETHILAWGIPYFLGRVYFSDAEGIKELAFGIFIGGLVYVPLCLFEIRMSPCLHKFVYGVHQHTFGQTKRFGGFRPMVFMQHGLMVGMWMTAASLMGTWLWMSGLLKKRPILRQIGVPILLITTVLCKSALAFLLLLFGLAVLLLVKRARSTLALHILLGFSLLYMGLRTVGGWSGQGLTSAVASIAPERLASVQSRLRSEDLFYGKYLERPIFGWAGWSRGVVRDEHGRYDSIPDAMWIVALNQRGLFGFTALICVFMLPAWLFALWCPPRRWTDRVAGPAAAVAVLLALCMMDNLANYMLNPAYLAASGALSAFLPRLRQLRRKSTPQASAVFGQIAGTAPGPERERPAA